MEALRLFAPALHVNRDEAEALADQVRLERYGEGEVVQRVGAVRWCSALALCPTACASLSAVVRNWQLLSQLAVSCRYRSSRAKTCSGSRRSPGKRLR